MGIDLRKDHPQTAQHAMAIAGVGEQPTGLRLALLIDAPESIAALVAYLKGKGRDGARFIRTALRITLRARPSQ